MSKIDDRHEAIAVANMSAYVRKNAIASYWSKYTTD